MLSYIREFRKYVEITGFSNAEISNVEEFLKTIHKEKPLATEIQFFNADLVATWQHLHFATLNALTAFKNKQNLSKSLAVETMLYASAQRQIQKATKTIGIKPDTARIAVLIIGGEFDRVKTALNLVSKHVKAEHDETVLEVSGEKTTAIQKAFGISDLELKTVMTGGNVKEALTDLVIERMALLATQK